MRVNQFLNRSVKTANIFTSANSLNISHICLFAICLFFFINTTAYSQKTPINSSEYGYPFIQNYSPKDHRGHAQNWCLAQDRRNVMYFGNGDGILEYDGASWRLIPLKYNSMCRSIFTSRKGIIYAGGNKQFGFLAPDNKGIMGFVPISTSPENGLKYSEILDIVEFDDAIFFRSHEAIFRYKNNNVKGWKLDSDPLKGVLIYKNSLFFSSKKDGLVELLNDELAPVSFGNAFKDKEIKFYFDQVNDVQTIGIRDEGIFEFNPEWQNQDSSVLRLVESELSDFAIANGYYDAVKLSNGQYVVASNHSHGVIVFDPQNENITQKLSSQRGLYNDKIHGLLLDNQQGLWCVLNNGISRVEIMSPITFWNKTNGPSGAFEHILRFKGLVYASTHEGLYYLEDNKLISVNEDKKRSWCLLNFSPPEAPSKQFLLTGMEKGLFEVIDNKLKLIAEVGTVYEMTVSRRDSSRIYLANNTGVASIKYKNGKWIYEGTIEGVVDDVRSASEDGKGNLWLGTFRNGAIRIELSDDITKPKSIKYYNKESGFGSIKNVLVYPYSKYLLFGSNTGLYRYDAEQDKMVPDPTFGDRYTTGNEDVFSFIETKKGNVWIGGLINSKSPLRYGVTQKNGTQDWLMHPFMLVPEQMNLTIYAEDDGTAWFGGYEGIFKYSPQNVPNYAKNFNVLIRNVTIGKKDSLIFGGTHYKIENNQEIPIFFQADSTIPSIDFEHNSINFCYAGLNYIQEEKNRYQFRLEGYDDNWSEWSATTQRRYTNLNEGKYIFKVRCRNLFGTQSDDATYSFIINAPWYRTIVAYVFFIILSILIVWSIIYLNLRRLKLQNIRLERTIRERTKEVREQNEEILTQNSEILQKNEEINTQTEKLEDTNKELEKLSIVASETDNAISIFNNLGTLEWINLAFEKMYGFTYSEIIKIKGNNILDLNASSQIRESFARCVNSKKSVTYENENEIRDGRKLWVQTTLSPIIDDNEQVVKLIAIDTDITKIKQAEKEILVQKRKVELQNDNIKGSIRYAKTIQQAILPTYSEIKKDLDIFIIFKPKDIVSGDFFWHSKVKTDGKKSYTFLAAVDCTGHGVPGAFMSMIGSRMLSEIVNEKKVFEPMQILDYMDNGIRRALKQDSTDNTDGMDTCLVRLERINKTDTKIVFAGAKRPLIYYTNDTKEVLSLRGARKSIGGQVIQIEKIEFEQHEITLKKKDIIYLSSDGLIDQNSADRKKFGTIKLIDILKNNADKTTEEQKQILEKELQEHQHGTEQRDDITLLGIRL